MDTAESTLGFGRKFSYSIAGLFAGDLVMLILLWLVFEAWEQPPSNFMRAFSFSVNCSFLGWVLVGIPAVFLINTSFVMRVRWYFQVLVGALLGSAALLMIFVIIGDHLPAQTWGYAYFWIFAALVSILAFGIYCALVRKAVRKLENNSALTAKDAQLQILRPLTRVDINHPELPLDIYKSDWLNTLEPSDPRRSTSELSRPPDSKPS